MSQYFPTVNVLSSGSVYSDFLMLYWYIHTRETDIHTDTQIYTQINTDIHRVAPTSCHPPNFVLMNTVLGDLKVFLLSLQFVPISQIRTWDSGRSKSSLQTDTTLRVAKAQQSGDNRAAAVGQQSLSIYYVPGQSYSWYLLSLAWSYATPHQGSTCLRVGSSWL